jgi:hypothetical protein
MSSPPSTGLPYGTATPAPSLSSAPPGCPAMPPERVAAAIEHARRLSETAARVALELPLQVDDGDFLRVLEEEARP